jgi:2-phospho-L-lactate/phosphoenolpyruvate guanylyltransferase
MRWTLLVPVKALPGAKSRLIGASADPDGHRRLVEAIRADTLLAARAAPNVARVVLVDGDGLNDALRSAADDAARRWPADGIAALVADLPALRSAELDQALASAARHPRTFVTDVAGTGTTMLAARPGVALDPMFGPGSAARHAAAAIGLDAGPGLRRDVDTAEELSDAIRLGVGPATKQATSPTVHPHPA